MIATRRLTAADLVLFELNIDDYEILDGELRERKTVGGLHGRVGFDIGWRIGNFVLARNLGELYTSATAFIIVSEPLSVLRPDVAFVKAERLPSEVSWSSFYAVVPDLVVEVLPPGDRQAVLTKKIGRYLHAGVALVWMVDPLAPTIVVYSPGRDPISVGADGVLDGGEILPGFRLPVAEVFR